MWFNGCMTKNQAILDAVDSIKANRDMDQGQQMAIVVISRRDTVGTACIGPFPTPEAAQEWRERHMADYPDGSQFDILTPTRPTY